MARCRQRPGPQRNVQALKDIIAFWLERGVAGFRVDMAFSLVKGYDHEEAQALTADIWRDIRQWLDVAYPDAVIIPEGREPRTGQPLAFDADFFLVIHAEHASLFDNHAAGTAAVPTARGIRSSMQQVVAPRRCSSKAGTPSRTPIRRGW